MRLPTVSRALVLSTLAAVVLLAAGGFVLGQSMGDEGTPASAPVQATPAPDQPDPIVVPEPLEVPSA